MGLKILSLLLLAAAPGVARADGVAFTGAAGTPLSYQPLVVEDAAGNPVDPSRRVDLTLPPDVAQQRAEQGQALTSQLAAQGYRLQGALGQATSLSISAGDYAAKLNDVEKVLNQTGHTLRAADGITAHEDQVIDRATVGDQPVAAAEVYLPATTPGLRQPPADGSVKTGHDAAAADPKVDDKKLYLASQKDKCEPSSATPAGTQCFAGHLPDPTPAPVSPLTGSDRDQCTSQTPLGRALLVDEPWSDAGGDSTFGWTADAAFKLTTDSSGLTIDLKGNATGMLIGKTKELVKGEAQFTSPRRGNASGKISLALVGHSIIDQTKSWDQNLASSKDADGKEQYVYGEEDPVLTSLFMIGFVPVSVDVSVKFSAGPSYQVDLLPVKIAGRGEMVEQATILAAAGIGGNFELFEVLAGIKGSLDLINATVGTYPEAGLDLTPENRPVITARIDGRAAMTTLDGKIELGVWAKTKFPVPQAKGGWPPSLELKPLVYSWSQTVGDYPGYRFPTAVIFDEKVGYDVCSGKKTHEVLVPSQPRPRDQRMDYEMQYLAKVRDLEQKVGRDVEAALDADETARVLQDAKASADAVTAIGVKLDQVTSQYAGG